MDNQKQELLTKLKTTNNVLVTVSANPSVDQLAACIGMTLLLNKLGKHATAVFSGQVPSTLQFLRPEDTLEKNTDSLRDFIVSLDKSKADKLRYKVENDVVKIFITPYKTSITEADLDFSQGDFNIDVVICLGVDNQADLDQAITSHGRILHDATVASVSIGGAGELGTLNWVEPNASSLSELAAQIGDAIGREQIDGQIATAFLTGIVAETERFSNEKTSPLTMQLSAQLMSAGANQQLIASELDAANAQLAVPQSDSAESAETPDEPKPDATPAETNTDGTLEIGHDGENGEDTDAPTGETPSEPDQPDDDSGTPPSADSPTDESTDDEPTEPSSNEQEPASRLILQPPSMGGQLTANSVPESFDPSVDPLTMLTSDSPLLDHQDTPAELPDDAVVPDPPIEATPSEPAAPVEPTVALPEVSPVEPAVADPVATVPQPEPFEYTAPSTDALPGFEPLPSEPTGATEITADLQTQPVDDGEKSLAELEQAVNSPHLQPGADDHQLPTDDALEAARNAVIAAANGGPQVGPLPPTQASGAEGYLDVQDLPGVTPEFTSQVPITPELTIPMPDPTPPTSVVEVPSTAPPVPPPLPLDPTQFLPKQ